ncbi:MAG: DMT family transporter [Ilumatobacteraceae bacterium]
MALRRSGALWVVISAVTYSLFAVFTKNALREGLRPTDLLVWRFAIAVPVIWAVVGWRAHRGGPRPNRAPVRHMFVLGVLFGVLALLAFTALDHLSASLYTVIIYTYPAMVAVGAWALGQPAPRLLWGALAVTLSGIALTTIPVALSASTQVETIGVVFTVLNATFYAVYVLWSGRLLGAERPPGQSYDGIVCAAWSLTGSLLFAVAVGLYSGVRAPHTSDAMLGLVGLAVISTVIAGMTLLIGMATLGPATAATIATLEPVLTLLWAVTLLNESLMTVQLAGAALVIGGVTWAQRMSVSRAVPRARRSPRRGLSPVDLPTSPPVRP